MIKLDTLSYIYVLSRGQNYRLAIILGRTVRTRNYVSSAIARLRTNDVKFKGKFYMTL